MLSLEKDKIRILLLEGVDPSAEKTFREQGYKNIESLSKALPEAALIDKLQGTYILGVRSRTQVTAEVLAQAPKLFAVGTYCIGTDQIALSAAALQGIPVFNAPHANTRSVAELVIGLTIMQMRDIFAKNSALHLGKWLKSAEGSHEIRGKIIGIVGYGHIGTQVSILAEAMGMRVVYYDIVSKLPLGNAVPLGSLEEVLAIADVVTLHVPDTQQTCGMMNAERFSKMKKGACLINASRGGVVDLEVLKVYLDNGTIKNAALDVFPQEPESGAVPFENLLKGDPRLILTPHIGGSTLEAQHNIGIEVTRKLISYSDGGSTEGAVNFPALSLPIHKDMHRILNVHRNIPGMLQKINKAVADENINVHSQYLLTNQEIGYVVLDIERKISQKLTDTLRRLEGSIRTRILY